MASERGWRCWEKRVLFRLLLLGFSLNIAVVYFFLYPLLGESNPSIAQTEHMDVIFKDEPDSNFYLGSQQSARTTSTSLSLTSRYHSLESACVEPKRVLLIQKEVHRTHAEQSGRRDPSLIAATPDSLRSFLEKHGLTVTVESDKFKEGQKTGQRSLTRLKRIIKGQKYLAVIVVGLDSCPHFGIDGCASLEQTCIKMNTGLVVIAGPDQSRLKGSNTDRTYSWLDVVRLSSIQEDPSLHGHGNVRIKLEPTSPVLHMTKSGQTWPWLPGNDWHGINCQLDVQCTPLLYLQGKTAQQTVAVSMEKKGHKTVLFGISNPLFFFLLRMLLLDALHFVSKGRACFPFVRHIQVDVDDTFMGDPGVRPHPDDIKELIASQNRLQEKISRFKYNFGFVGSRFKSDGTKEELLANLLLMKNAHLFRWFPHMWNHSKANLQNASQLISSMIKNRDFAKMYHLPISHYSVTPHHSGIYPVHDALYTAWKKVWNITVTSTEEYMHLKPAYRRRGFLYRGIKVLPRQTCGLFTHTLTYKTYPGGRRKLNERIFGGEIFHVLFDNPVVIYMTHYVNFGQDRLAPYLLESLVEFVANWTNLRIVSGSPSELAEEYFKHFPNQLDPIWLDPCIDVRHYSRWAGANKACLTLPSVLLLGPEETATKFLLGLLLYQGDVFTVKNRTADELKFLGGENYKCGLEWYMNQFPAVRRPVRPVHNMSNPYAKPPHIVEKVTAAFIQPTAALHAWRLLQYAQVIVILTEPVEQTLSCLQHLTQPLSPQSILDELDDASRDLNPNRSAVHQCLSTSLYVKHLEHWLKHYSAKQVMILGRKSLLEDPVGTTKPLFDRLKLKPVQYKVKYINGETCISSPDKPLPVCSDTVNFSQKKQFLNARIKDRLERFFKPYNHQLARLLGEHNFELPSWIDKA